MKITPNAARELLAVIAERIRKDKLASAAYVGETARRIAHVTLDALATNIVLEIEGRDRSMSDLCDSFLKACGPTCEQVYGKLPRTKVE